MKTTRHENTMKFKMIFTTTAVAFVIFGALGCQNPTEAASTPDGVDTTITSVFPVQVISVGANGEEKISTDATLAAPESSITLSVDNLGEGREVSFATNNVELETTSVAVDGTVIFEMPAQPVEITATFTNVQSVNSVARKTEVTVDNAPVIDGAVDEFVVEEVESNDDTAEDVAPDDGSVVIVEAGTGNDGEADDATIDDDEEVIVENAILVNDSKATDKELAKAQRKAERKAARLAKQNAIKEARQAAKKLARTKIKAEKQAEKAAKQAKVKAEKQAKKAAEKEAKKLAKAEKQEKAKGNSKK